MEAAYEKHEEMTFIGFHTEIPSGEGYLKCPEFWQQAFSAKYERLFKTGRPETAAEAAVLENGIGAFAICVDGETRFTYWIAGIYRGGDVPEGFGLYTIPAGEWAVFSAKGPLPGSLQTLNTAVWREWFPEEGKRRGADGRVTLEVYGVGDPASPDYECAILVPLQG